MPHAQNSPAAAARHWPRAPGFDNTLALLAEGYQFMPRRHIQLDSDVFTTRLMLREAVCVRGEEAVRMFYHPGRFTRRGALPPTALMLLQDYGSALVLDDAAHRHRKGMLMSLQGDADRARLVELAHDAWRTHIAGWPGRVRVVLHDEARQVMCRAACAWAGVPASELELQRRTREFAAMIDAAGAAGPRNWSAQLLRIRTEHWARELVEAVRAGRLAPDPGGALAVIARHRDLDEQLLPARAAAVELLNMLRPVVAVARWIVFGALALHRFPRYRDQLASGDDAWLTAFAQEVRRFYPFFPAVGGRARARFAWRGVEIEEGSWFLLDLYGTNHDRRLWDEPGTFRPERFLDWRGSGYDLVPQGGGDYLTGHRCAGEMVTVELVKSALHLLAGTRYQVPPQDLRVSLSRMPTLPASGMVLAPSAPAS